MRVRGMVVITLTGTGQVVDLSARPRHTTADARSQPVRVVVVNRQALDVALEIAQGNKRRLWFNPDGSITVAATPRGP